MSNIPVYTYEEARVLIEDGDIVFVKSGNSISAKLIKFFLASEYNHVCFAFWFEDNRYKTPRLLDIEEHLGGQRIVNLSMYKDRELEVVKNPFDWYSMGGEILDDTGSIPYGYGDFITIGLRETFNLKLKNLRGQVCSEMIALWLKKQGVKLETTLVSPGKLRQLLLDRGFKVKFSVKPKG